MGDFAIVGGFEEGSVWGTFAGVLRPWPGSRRIFMGLSGDSSGILLLRQEKKVFFNIYIVKEYLFFEENILTSQAMTDLNIPKRH